MPVYYGLEDPAFRIQVFEYLQAIQKLKSGSDELGQWRLLKAIHTHFIFALDAEMCSSQSAVLISVAIIEFQEWFDSVAMDVLPYTTALAITQSSWTKVMQESKSRQRMTLS